MSIMSRGNKKVAASYRIFVGWAVDIIHIHRRFLWEKVSHTTWETKRRLFPGKMNNARQKRPRGCGLSNLEVQFPIQLTSNCLHVHFERKSLLYTASSKRRYNQHASSALFAHRVPAAIHFVRRPWWPWLFVKKRGRSDQHIGKLKPSTHLLTRSTTYPLVC
jgi:hypothetical protein